MTTATSQKVALVTGASSGIGQATVLRLHAAGFIVYGVARRIERMAHLEKQGIKTLAMDVTDEESTTLGIKQILAQTGRIDVLVNNAGYGSYGAVEDVPLEEARRQFEVNLFGAARLIQLVLPGMRERRSGTIVNVTSMGGKIYTPFGAWYHATKFAFEAFSDCLRLETKEFGIDVVIIEPGAIATEFNSIVADHLDEASGAGAYAKQTKSVAEVTRSESTAKRASSPEVIANTIVKAAAAGRPKTRYAVGSGARPLLFIHRCLPTRAYDALMRRMTGMR
ncbi:short-chain dehydrogenase [Janibacter sp. Soil728]|uniref:oxidoreductase n=1 Tax=Janibacter sp. Soil728 TaxID=1736393 RepID=UPI000701F0A9|nr:oxidoreductase [Janibacter sp. Soil728]KRE39157.1 short-chain dehydrogenase [Janibacter sp. Soil728]